MTETDAKRILREVEERRQAEKAVSPIEKQCLRMVKKLTRPAKVTFSPETYLCGR